MTQYESNHTASKKGKLTVDTPLFSSLIAVDIRVLYGLRVKPLTGPRGLPGRGAAEDQAGYQTRGGKGACPPWGAAPLGSSNISLENDREVIRK
jgi:hypothetical protein